MALPVQSECSVCSVQKESAVLELRRRLRDIMADLNADEVCPNAPKTHTTPLNPILQEMIGVSPELDTPPDHVLQTPLQLIKNSKSTSLTPLLQRCQLQTPVSLSIKTGYKKNLIPGTVTWVAPLAWLEQTMPDYPVLTSLRQSLPFPPSQQNQGTCITPISATSTATCTTPLILRETGMNTSLEEKASTKDNTAETDSLLWHCSPNQLSGLSRVELEGRLESTLIIMEALSHKLRDCQKFHQSAALVALADQREAATQTLILDPRVEEQLYHNLYVDLGKRYHSLQRSHASEQMLSRKLAGVTKEMKEWSSDSKKFQDIIDTSFKHIKEDRIGLNQQQEQMRALLSRCKSKVQGSFQDQKDMKTRLEKALQKKEAAVQVLESFRTHTGARIKELKQSSELQQRLLDLLKEARDHQVDLSKGYGKYVEEGNHLATAMQEDWTQMQFDYKVWMKMMTRSWATIKGMQEEVKAARRERAQHKEVCDKLEASTVDLVHALGRVNQLTEANVSLRKELEALLLKATAAEGEKERMEQERGILSQCLADKEKHLDEMTCILQEKEQQWKKMQRDLREALDCREFMEQESQVVQNQLSETEEELKVTLSTLRERSTHLEDLKDSYGKLQQEQEVVSKELARTKAELQDLEITMVKVSKASLEIRGLQEQFINMADILKVMDAPQKSRPCTPAARQTPHRLGTSFVDSILQAAAEKDVETPTNLWSNSSAFTKATPVVPPTPAEVEESLETSILELQETTDQFYSLICKHQKAMQGLQAENLQLEHLLESQKMQLQADLDSHAITIAKLSRSLHASLQNEKELQDAIQQQDMKLQLLMDQSSDVVNLQQEVAQLTRALKKAETEVLTLWEELKGDKSDVGYIQEKVLLQQEMAKLRELLLEKENESAELAANHSGQVSSLKNRLHQAQQALSQHRKTEAKMREVLSTLPPDMAKTSELRHILEIF